MKNVSYIIFNVDKAVTFEWIADNLNKEKINLSFILFNNKDTYLERYLKNKDIPVYRIKFTGKRDIVKSIIKLYFLFRKLKTDIINTHFYEASYMGMIAGKLAGVKMRIISRHHTTIHHEYFRKGVWVDKLANRLSTHIIAGSENVAQVLEKMENVPSKKIHTIYYGFKLDLYENTNEVSVASLREKYLTNGFYPIIGVLARQTEWKGIQFIIPAFKELLTKYPDAKLILGGAAVEYTKEIEALLKQIPARNYVSFSFENDITSFFKIFDVYVHVPIDQHCEAFGQTYVEALASGVPSVFTISGIASSFIKDKENALVVPYQDSKSIYNSIVELINNKELTQKVISNGRKDVKRLFEYQDMIVKLEKLLLGN